jgi:rubrerythrin
MRDIQQFEPSANQKVYALIEFGCEAIALYAAAIRRTQDLNLRCMLEQFRADHIRHTRVLARQLRMLGTEPPRGLDFRPVLADGPKAIGELLGDREVLRAVARNERETLRVYSGALLDASMPARLLQTIRQNLDDEYRHATWIRAKLAALSSGSS